MLRRTVDALLEAQQHLRVAQPQRADGIVSRTNNQFEACCRHRPRYLRRVALPPRRPAKPAGFEFHPARQWTDAPSRNTNGSVHADLNQNRNAGQHPNNTWPDLFEEPDVCFRNFGIWLHDPERLQTISNPSPPRASLPPLQFLRRW